MWLADRLVNLVSGMGGPKDKAPQTIHAPSWMSPLEALNAYRGDWIARKVVDIPATDMIRAGRNWQATNDQVQAIETEQRRLKLQQRVLQALKWSRLFGGAALILGTDQGDPATPLDLDAIGLGGLTYVHACTRLELTAGALDRDPMSTTFGEPTYYQLERTPTADPLALTPPAPNAVGGIVQVHPSRVVRFVGNELPDPTFFGGGYGLGWGDSVLQAVNDAVINAGIASGGIASLVLEAKVDVYSIPNLTQNVGNADYRTRMIERFSLANTGKSLQNALLLDSNEVYAQKTVNFNALPDILTLYLEIAAAAADIPATRMLAKQSKGLGNAGEGDLKNYYDKISSDQEMTLRPALEKVDEALLRSALGSRPKEIYWSFAPLWQTSDVERAGIRKSDADTAASYVASGLIPKAALAASVQNQLVEANAYPGLEAALDALGDADEGQAWTGVGTAELTGLLAAWQSGAITHETLFNALQRGGVIEQGVTFEAYVEQIENEAPAPTAGIEGVTLDPVTGAPVDPNAPPVEKPALKIVGKDAAPRTLYVSRSVTNAAAILAWAKGQGFTDTLKASDLHVTIVFSRTPVDWMAAGSDWSSTGKLEIPAGGPRMMERFGDAVVLLFASSDLQWRHEAIKEIGASFDYDQYQPHVTITYAAPPTMDLTKVEPYQGPIVLGPEIFAEVDDDWTAKVDT